MYLKTDGKCVCTVNYKLSTKYWNDFTDINCNYSVANFVKEEYFKFDVDVRNSSYMSSYYHKMKDIIFIFVVVGHIYVSSLRNALLNNKISYNSLVSSDHLHTGW